MLFIERSRGRPAQIPPAAADAAAEPMEKEIASRSVRRRLETRAIMIVR